ncbi:MAG: response regulator transcription factor [Chloroflexota bacterium]
MKLLICDDQAIVRDGLYMILRLEEGIEIVGLAENGADAVETAATYEPDLVLMDLQMPVMNGIEATRRIVEAHPQTKVVVLTTYDADEWVFDALQAGAVGYLLKDTPHEQLVAAIRGTLDGQSFVDPNIAGKLIAQVSSHPAPQPPTWLDDLTEREGDVLRLIAQGKTNQEIAETLFLSIGTVRNYESNIFAKIGVSDRTQAALLAQSVVEV